MVIRRSNEKKCPVYALNIDIQCKLTKDSKRRRKTNGMKKEISGVFAGEYKSL